MKKIKFKSLKSQLLVSFLALIVIICIGVSLISLYISKKSLEQTVRTTLPEVAKQASLSIENEIKVKIGVLELLAENEKLKNESTPINEKIEVLSKEMKRSGYLGVSYVDNKGKLTGQDGKTFNISEQDNFKKAMSGLSNISDPIVSKVNRSSIVLYTVPIKNNGKIIGCICASRDGNEISAYTNEVKFGKTGQAFAIDKEGIMIADSNKKLVMDKYNVFKKVEKDSQLKSLVEIEKKMIASKTGVGEYCYNRKSKYIGYAPVKGTDWSIGIAIDKGEILKELVNLQIGIGITAILFILIGSVIVVLISKSIIKPINMSMKELEIISEGNLTEETSKQLLHRKDELGNMAKAIEFMRKTMIDLLKNIKTSSSNIDSETDNVSSISEESYASSQNISVAINEVAKGTENQSQDLIDITSILQEFSSKLNNMVNVIKDVDLSTNNIKTRADNSNKDMENVIKSVESVNDAFKDLIAKIKRVGINVTKINEITNLINEVSEQTNLLALNAAIEAARAGEVGKGFSVVADEIRKLAEQSKESSGSISSLISEISKDTKVMVNTTDIMKKQLENQENDIGIAMKSFETITVAVDEIQPKMEVTTNYAEEVNSNKENILNKVEMASSVAEETSASSEEISASTQEMNKSSENLSHSLQLLNDMSKKMMENVNKFKIEK